MSLRSGIDQVKPRASDREHNTRAGVIGASHERAMDPGWFSGVHRHEDLSVVG